MFSMGMAKELGGFDTAIRMFAEAASGGTEKKKDQGAKSKSFWQKHKGKILAGAAAIAAAGAGAWGYKQKKRADAAEAGRMADRTAQAKTALDNSIIMLQQKTAIKQLKQNLSDTMVKLAKVEADYHNDTTASEAAKEAMRDQISTLNTKVKTLKRKIADMEAAERRRVLYENATPEETKKLDDMTQAVKEAKELKIGALPAGDLYL